MATFYRCDRCKKEVSNSSQILQVEGPKALPYGRIGHVSDLDTCKYDLCEDCTRALHSFLRAERTT